MTTLFDRLTMRRVETLCDARLARRTIAGLIPATSLLSMEASFAAMSDYLAAFTRDPEFPVATERDWHAVIGCIVLPQLISGGGYFERRGGRDFLDVLSALSDLETSLASYVPGGLPSEQLGALRTLTNSIREMRLGLAVTTMGGDEETMKASRKRLRAGIQLFLWEAFPVFLAMKMKADGMRCLARPEVLARSGGCSASGAATSRRGNHAAHRR